MNRRELLQGLLASSATVVAKPADPLPLLDGAIKLIGIDLGAKGAMLVYHWNPTPRHWVRGRFFEVTAAADRLWIVPGRVNQTGNAIGNGMERWPATSIG
jgi:hypothetical protein